MLSEARYLKKVHMTNDVYASCLQHALTTEKEEVMGLLIGEVDEHNCISHISACVVLHRSDKQPDRVEISPEQLYIASGHAEELACKLGKPMRVVGWYHSHPHITVWPSHVDVRTQLTYQMMDPLFIGLIFSVYQNDTGSVRNNVQLTCFQAVQNGVDYQRREIELELENSELRKHNIESIASLPRILSQEEVVTHENEKDSKHDDILASLHNDAFRTMALVHIVSKVAKPVSEDLEIRLKLLKLRIKQVEQLKKALMN